VKTNYLKTVFMFYVNGFREMKLGKTLWKIILLKLAVILLFLNYFVYDRSIKSEYKTEDEKADFVYKNLVKKGEENPSSE
jgi:hypothetical protein